MRSLPVAAALPFLLLVSLTGPVAAPAGRPAPTADDPAPGPAWDDDALRDCQGDCSWAYATAQWEFNVCYACFCLVRSAETAGELESAISQCRFELARRR